MGLAYRLAAQLVFYGINAIGAYAALNFLLFLARPLLHGWPITAATAVTVPPMVVVMIHVVAPFALRARASILDQA